MKFILKILVSILLFFNGTGAIYGGWNLIIYPDGRSIQLSPDWLENTPFTNYLIPGIILFLFNGLFSIYVLIAVLSRDKNNSFLILVQGAILTGWIVIQVIMIQTVYFLHIIMGSVGILLIICARIMKKFYAGYS